MNTIRSAQRGVEEINSQARALEGYLDEVDSLIGAAGDLLGGAVDIEHEGEAGHWVSAADYQALYKAHTAVE